MTLAWVTEDDAQVLAALHATAFAAPWDAAGFRDLMAGPGAFGLTTPGGLVLCRVVADEMEVLTLAVEPDKRRRGVARLLMTAALDFARQAGARQAFLEVADDNPAATALYAGLGFRRSGVRRAYYDRGSAPRADALVMRLDLEPSDP